MDAGACSDIEQPVEAAPAQQPSGPVVNLLTQNGQKHSTQVSSLDASVGELKGQITTLTGVPAELQRLIFMGKVLTDQQSLASCRIEDGSTVHLFARISPPPAPAVVVSSANGAGQVQVATVVPGAAGPNAQMATVVVAGNDETMGLGMGILRVPHRQRNNNDPDLAWEAHMQPAVNRRVKIFSALLLFWNVVLLFQTFLSVSSRSGNNTPESDPNRIAEVPPNNALENTLEIGYQLTGAYVGLVGYRAATMHSYVLAVRYHRMWCLFAALFIAFNVSKVVRQGQIGDGGSSSFAYLAARWLLIPLVMWGYCIVQASRFRSMLSHQQ
jgi:hypothetical protein